MDMIAARFARSWAWVIVLVVAARAAHAETIPLATVAGSGIEVNVDAWAGLDADDVAGRDVGLVQIVVTITNNSAVDRLWAIETERSYGTRTATTKPVTRLAVPAGGTAKAAVFVDPGLPGAYGKTWVPLTVSGYGLIDGRQLFQVTSWNPSVAATAVTGATGKSILPTALSKGAASQPRQLGLERFAIPGLAGLDMDRAPDDWRGWSTFSCLLFVEAEWLAMSAGQRKALLDWVSLGGMAGLVVDDASAARLDAIGLPATDADGRRRVGAGEIVPVPREGGEAAVERFLGGRSVQPRAELLEQYVAAKRPVFWESGFRKLFDVFGPRLMPVTAILGFLAIFGLVAGPLNVMLLAGPGRRSRIFWTTPLISLAATALLLGFMVVRDGFGGAGARRTLGLLMPGQNGMAVIQEQYSRTGVLRSTSFPIAEPSWMRLLGDGETEASCLEVDGRVREGDWFASRSDQAYLLQTVRPSRAGIEWVGGGAGPPAVISSIEVPLDRLFLIDDEGRYWTASDLGTGERKPLEPSDAAAYAAWFKTIAADAGPIRRAALDAVRDRRGHAYAESARAGKVAIQTLPSIRWTDDRAAFVGPFTRTSPP
jgi:hypothetical protein